jgi:hypothetical protein
LQAVQSGSFAFRYDAGWSLRRAGARCCALQMRIFMPAELQIRQDEGHCP